VAAARPCELGGSARSCGCLVFPALPHRGCLRCLPSSCAYVLCVWLTFRGGAFHGARLDVPDSLGVLHCAVCLESDTTSDPFFRCAVVLQNEDSQALIALSYTPAAASAVGVALGSKGRLLPFVACCSARCLASFLSRGLVLCLRRAGKAFSALRGCVPSASALGSGRGGAACGLEVRGPVLKPQWAASAPALRSRTGRSGGVAVMGRRGAPSGLALGERPWPLMT